MKRLVGWRLQRAQKVARRRARHISLSRARRQNNSRTKATLQRQRRYQTLAAPVHFILNVPGPRAELLRLLVAMRSLVKEGKGVRIDFSRTKKMYPCGTILFMAELDRIVQGVGRGTVIASHPKDRIVEQVIQKVGIASLLGLKRRFHDESLGPSVRHWRYASGSQAEGEKTSAMLDHYRLRLAVGLTRSLYEGIVEAMSNSMNHAYIAARADGSGADESERRWWMFWQESKGSLSVAICDLGIGIPASLDNKVTLRDMLDQLVAKFGLATPFASKIKAAMELGRSRTNLPHRGKGLDDILDVVRKGVSGGLRITSGRGFYLYDAGSQADTLTDFGDDVMGTIVQWNIPLLLEAQ